MIEPHKIANALFETLEKEEHLYTILDGARTGEIPSALQTVKVNHCSLYYRRPDQALWDVAPYLVKCERGMAFVNWIIEKGWGNSWGIYLEAKANLEELYEHFQKFILVKLEDNREFYFRFYDPRVLRSFIPTCTLEEIREFFGPIRCYFAEDQESLSIVSFSMEPFSRTLR